MSAVRGTEQQNAPLFKYYPVISIIFYRKLSTKFTTKLLRRKIYNLLLGNVNFKLDDPNVQFIDVRDKDSFSKGTIGNAIHLDRAFLEFYLAEGSPLENKFFKENPDKEYVVFCGVGGQGTLSTKTMKDMGIKNVKNITGGMAEWEKLKK